LLAISHFKAKTKYKKGESIFQTGEPYRGVFLIKYGVVKLERVSAGGRPFIVKIVGMEVLSVIERNNKFIQHYSATALSEVECCFIPAESFKEILKNSPDLENQIGEEHLKDLAMLEQKTMNLAYQSVREKIADALLLITEVYNYSQTHKSFCIDLSRQDIANLTTY
jgi:CRP-like cAMP-binding protein